VLGGTLAPVLEAWQAGRFMLVVTDDIVHEYQAVLCRSKFRLPGPVLDGIIGYVFRRAEFVNVVEPLHVIAADPSDDRFLEATVAGQAEAIVSGDRHLLSLGTFQGIAIVSGRWFLERLTQGP